MAISENGALKRKQKLPAKIINFRRFSYQEEKPYQNLLIIALELGDMDEGEFLMFSDINRTHNLDLPYWKYEKFDLDHLENDECVAKFQFQKDDIYDLPGVIQVPDKIVCYNGFKVSDVEALCIFLERHAYPCRYSDLIHRFARPVPELCIIKNFVLKFLYERWRFIYNNESTMFISKQSPTIC